MEASENLFSLKSNPSAWREQDANPTPRLRKSSSVRREEMSSVASFCNLFRQALAGIPGADHYLSLQFAIEQHLLAERVEKGHQDLDHRAAQAEALFCSVVARDNA